MEMQKRWYILDGKTTKPVDSLEEWGKWIAENDRRVALDKIGKIIVSTVFLGLDHSYMGGPPTLFETMVFKGKHDGHTERYHTWDEAEAGHARITNMVRGNHDKDSNPA